MFTNAELIIGSTSLVYLPVQVNIHIVEVRVVRVQVQVLPVQALVLCERNARVINPAKVQISYQSVK